jgi:DNA-binding response OmpR family regulator
VAKIIIVDDDPGNGDEVKEGLQDQGFETEVVSSAERALDRVRDGDADLVLLSLRSTGPDGLQLIAEIRDNGGRLPIIVIAPEVDDDDVIAGLDAGADDLIEPSDRLESLAARIRARMRAASYDLEMREGDITLDLRTRSATFGDRAVELTAREYSLLEAFLRRPNEVLGRDQLLSEVWGDEESPSSNVVDVYVLYLRRKLGEGVIETVRGRGYRLCPEGDHQALASLNGAMRTVGEVRSA